MTDNSRRMQNVTGNSGSWQTNGSLWTGLGMRESKKGGGRMSCGVGYIMAGVEPPFSHFSLLHRQIQLPLPILPEKASSTNLTCVDRRDHCGGSVYFNSLGHCGVVGVSQLSWPSIGGSTRASGSKTKQDGLIQIRIKQDEAGKQKRGSKRASQ